MVAADFALALRLNLFQCCIFQLRVFRFHACILNLFTGQFFCWWAVITVQRSSANLISFTTQFFWNQEMFYQWNFRMCVFHDYLNVTVKCMTSDELSALAFIFCENTQLWVSVVTHFPFALINLGNSVIIQILGDCMQMKNFLPKLFCLMKILWVNKVRKKYWKNTGCLRIFRMFHF